MAGISCDGGHLSFGSLNRRICGYAMLRPNLPRKLHISSERCPKSRTRFRGEKEWIRE